MCWFESGQGHHNNFKYIRHFATGRRSLLPLSKSCSKSWPGADALLKACKGSPPPVTHGLLAVDQEVGFSGGPDGKTAFRCRGKIDNCDP